MVHLQDEFLRKSAIVSGHAFHLDAGVSLVRERAVTDRKWFSWNENVTAVKSVTTLLGCDHVVKILRANVARFAILIRSS